VAAQCLVLLWQDVLKKVQQLVGEQSRPVRFGSYDAREVSTSRRLFIFYLFGAQIWGQCQKILFGGGLYSQASMVARASSGVQ